MHHSQFINYLSEVSDVAYQNRQKKYIIKKVIRYQLQGYFMISMCRKNARQPLILPKKLSLTSEESVFLPQIVRGRAEQHLSRQHKTSKDASKENHDPSCISTDNNISLIYCTVATMTSPSQFLQESKLITGSPPKLHKHHKIAPVHRGSSKLRCMPYFNKQSTGNAIKIVSIQDSLEKQAGMLEKALFKKHNNNSTTLINKHRQKLKPVIYAHRPINCRQSDKSETNEQSMNRSLGNEGTYLLPSLSQSFNSSHATALRFGFSIPESTAHVLTNNKKKWVTRQLSIYQLLQLYLQFHSQEYSHCKLRGNLCTKLIRNCVLLWNQLKAQQLQGQIDISMSIDANKAYAGEQDELNQNHIRQATKQYFNQIFQAQNPGSYIKKQLREAMKRVEQQFLQIAQNYQRVPFEMESYQQVNQQTIGDQNCFSQGHNSEQVSEDTSQKKVQQIHENKSQITSQNDVPNIGESFDSNHLTIAKTSLKVKVVNDQILPTNSNVSLKHPKSNAKQQSTTQFDYKDISQLEQSQQPQQFNLQSLKYSQSSGNHGKLMAPQHQLDVSQMNSKITVRNRQMQQITQQVTF